MDEILEDKGMIGGCHTSKIEGWNKHVESVWFPCADEGSIPSSSTL